MVGVKFTPPASTRRPAEIRSDRTGPFRAAGRSHDSLVSMPETSTRSRWFGRSRWREAENRDLTRESLPSVMLPDPSSPDAPGVRQSTSIADVFACVRVLVDGAMMAPLQVYRRSTQGRERVTDGDTVSILDRARAGCHSTRFRRAAGRRPGALGGDAVGKYRAPDGSLAQLGVLAPDLIEVEIVGGQPRFKYHQPNRPPVENLTLDDICHIRGLTLDGVRGASPVKVCREAVALGEVTHRCQPALWRTCGPGRAPQLRAAGRRGRRPGPSPRRRLEHPPRWSQEPRPRRRRHRGDQLAERRHAADRCRVRRDPPTLHRQVARIFHLPPWTIGAPSGDSLTYATVAEQANAFVKFSLGPWLRLVEEGLSAPNADLSAAESLRPL